MVIDDEREVALTVEFALRALGHDVRVAFDSLAGLRAVSQWRPHVAFVDIVMPVVDGWELARSIRRLRLPAPPRLIAMSGFASTTDRERSRMEGFEHHLAKPVSVADLARLVDRTN